MEKCCICGYEMDSVADFQRERCISRRDGLARYIPRGCNPDFMTIQESRENDLDLARVACVCTRNNCKKAAARLLDGPKGSPAPPKKKRLSFGSVLPPVPESQEHRHERQERRKYALRGLSESDFR